MGGKSRTMMRADLRTDLKDSGSVWSDAELNRSIERAISDFTRMLPDEKSYELSLQFAITDESITFPAAANDDLVVDDADISATAAGDTLTIAAQPDVPRPLVLTITDANSSIVSLDLIVKGSDKDDLALEETFHYYKGITSVTGLKYFKTVNEVEVDQISGNGADDKLNLGTGGYDAVWVYLANKPIKWDSETGTDAASNSLARNTDYFIDYIEGRLQAISGGNIAAGEACTFSYTKMQVGVDISNLADLLRVQRVEYPVGDLPQNFVSFDTFGKVVYITGGGESEEQQRMAEDKHVRIYYDAEYIPPNDYAPGTIPEFMENTVLLAASAYALLIEALQYEHQTATDLTSMRTTLASANTAHTALGTALTNIKKYLDNNSDADAAGILQDITDDATKLRTAIATALDAANAYLDSVAADITAADNARANYMGATANYVDGGTEPDIKAYLTSGDAILNTVAVGGEGVDVPRAYREYAEATRAGLVNAHEQDRQFYLDDATRRSNAALAYVQEAAQRVSNLRSYIEQSAGYTAIASLFAREAEARLNEINAYLSQASGYASAASGDITLADRYRDEAIMRRDEAWSIWHDRKQYIGDFTMSSVRQMPRYSGNRF